MRWSRSPAVVVLLVSAGCAALNPLPSHGEAPADCLFPPGTELAFAGESTLAELGLDGEHPDLRARFYVTAEAVDQEGLGDGFPQHRRYCALTGGGAGFSGPVPLDWQPPR